MPAAPGSRTHSILPPRTSGGPSDGAQAAAACEEVLVNSTGSLVDASGNSYDRDWRVPARQEHSPSGSSACAGALVRSGVRRGRPWGGFREGTCSCTTRTRICPGACVAVGGVVYVHGPWPRARTSSGTDSPMFIGSTPATSSDGRRPQPCPGGGAGAARTLVRSLRGAAQRCWWQGLFGRRRSAARAASTGEFVK